jgi:type I restriction-modification system DNA methylase subunit
VKTKKITKCISNPPYEKKYHPIEIMENIMNNMEKNGKAVFLLRSGALRVNTKSVREKILTKHSLKTIIKLPEIFEGVAGAGEVALFVFEVGKPQKKKDKAFGY